VYQRPPDPHRPLICLDEAAKQLLADARAPLPVAPAQPERVDYEYVRRGTAARFMAFEPLAGQRHVFVREQRTRTDFAAVIKTLVDELYPQAERLVVVLDQLNTHGVASLYAAYPPVEARRLAQKLEIHHTPKHGSWLKLGGVGTVGLGPTVLGGPDGSSGVPDSASRRLAAGTQRRRPARGLAFHDGRREDQTQAPLPRNPTLNQH
jgi:hypothetical protein